MNKRYSRIFALLLALVMVSATCIVATAATMTAISTSTPASGVVYQKHTARGDGGTSNAYTLSYNTKTSDYITMPFMAWAGSAASLASNYTQATNGARYSYNVAGLINGGYFALSNGTHCGNTLYDGRVACASDMYAGPLAAFMSDGTVKLVNYSALTFDLTIGNSTYYRTIQNINKISTTTYGCFHYYDSACGTKCDSKSAGTEIICNKLGGTELYVGRDLIGQVVKINKNSYGCAVGSDQFVLWLPNGSNYESYIAGLTVGETIKIKARETSTEAGAKEAIENCVGALSIPGVLVRDGVDLTRTNSTIGDHAVNGLYRAWTAVGIKPDGTHILFVNSETDCYDLQNVAQVLIAAGCNNVFRLDGGGSAAMYVKGTGNVYNQGRAVTDVVMAVSRSCMKKYKAELGALINELSECFAYIGEPAVLKNARTVYNTSTSVDADYRRAILDLNALGSKHDILGRIIDSAKKLDADTCSDRKSDWVQKAVMDAVAVRNNSAASDGDCMAQIRRLNELLASDLSGNRISLGKAYDCGAVNPSFPDTGKKELTNGDILGEGISDPAWTGFNKSGKVGSDTIGDYTEIYIDLGSSKAATGAMLTAFCNKTVSAPSAVKVFASQDGESFIEYLSLSECNESPSALTDRAAQYEALGNVNARYFVFRVYFGGNNLFIGEATVYGAETVPDTGVDAFEARITENSVSIFTGFPNLTLNHNNANLTYANSLVCRYDTSVGAYVVTDIISPNGNRDYSVTVPENGFIVAMHGSAWYNRLDGCAGVGDIVCLNGIDIKNKTLGAAASIAFVDPAPAVTRKEVTPANVFMNKNVAEVKGEFIKLGRNKTANDLMYAYIGKNADITVKGNSVGGETLIGTGASFTDDGTVYEVYVPGDISGDAKINAVDYMLLKRGYLGAYSLSAAQKKAGALTNGDTLVAIDYVKLKRAVLGTYNIPD